MGIDAVGLQPSVTTVAMTTRQENLHNFVKKGKVCNICGDAGFDDCLAVCSQCNEGAEHLYCMMTIPDTLPLDWVCEGCKVKQNTTCGKRRFVHDGLQTIQGYKKQILSRVASSSSAKSTSEDMGFLHNSSFKKSFSENGTKHFNSMQADKSPPRGPASQVQPRGGGNLRETSLPETNLLSCSNILTQKVGSHISINGNSGVVAPDVMKPSSTVIPARCVLAKAAPCSETDMAVSSSRGHEDNETITRRDWPIVSPKIFTETISTVSKSLSEVKSAGVVAPVEGALVKDTQAVALDVEVSGERLQCEEKGIYKLPFKTGAGNLLPVEADLTEPLEGVLVKDTPAIILDIEVSCESVPCEEKECINMDLTPLKACEGNLLSVGAEHHNLGFTTGLSPFPMQTSSQPGPVQGGSMKGVLSSVTGNVVPVCRTAPKHLTSTAEKNSVTAYKDAPNYIDISIERSTSNLQDAIINSAAMKAECGKFVITSRSHASKGKIARRDFPIITQKIKILGEKCEKTPNFKSKGKLPQKVGASSGVKVLSCPPLPNGGEETANEQETEPSCNRLQVNEEVNVIESSSNLCCKGEKGQHQSGGVLVKEPSGQETDGSCNGLQAKSAGSPYGLDKVASVSRISPTAVSAVETNIESVALPYCASKEPSSGLVPRQEESMKGASSAGTDKIVVAHSKRVIRTRSHKVAYAGKLAPSIEADHDYTDEDFLAGRNAQESQCAFHRTAPMMADDSEPSVLVPGLKDFMRKKSAARSSVIGPNESTRDKHRNSTFIGREPEDDCFHARHKDGGCQPSDRAGFTKSTVVGQRHRTSMGSDLEYRTIKHDHYSRDSRSWARDSDSYKGAYRCHRCNGVGHSTEFCKARSIDREREWRTTDSSDFDDRDSPENRSDPGHVKRPFPGFHSSDGRKRWRDDPRNEEKFKNRRSRVESSAVDCAGMCSKRPPKVFEHTRHDEEHRYKSHTRHDAEHRYKSQLRDETGYERVTSRSESLHSLNGKKVDLKLSGEPSEYTRVHKRQIVRVETQGNCKAGFGAPRLPERSPPQAPSFKNGKAFPGQGDATSFQAAPAGPPRGGYLQKLLPSQVSLTPQDEVCKETTSQTSVRPRLQGSSRKSFPQERRAVPDLQVLWTGCFNVTSTTSSSTCYKGVQAHPSTVADPKVFEVLLALPLVLELGEMKRGVETDSWPRSFQEYPPTRHSIGVYFVPVDMQSHDTWFQPLLHHLSACDLALKVKLESAQLLIFSSQLLPEAEQLWNGRFFLWGIFRKNKVREAIEDSSPLIEPHSDKDHGSDLGSPKGNGEVIDMDGDMVGGEDAEWQDISPPLPPGFSPTRPHPP